MEQYTPAPAPMKHQVGVIPTNVPAEKTAWDLFDFSAAKKQIPFIKLGSPNSKDAKEYPHIAGCIYSSLTKEILAEPGRPLYFTILGAQRYITTSIYNMPPLAGRSHIGGNERPVFEQRERAEHAKNFKITPYEGQAYGAGQTLYRREEVFFAILPVKNEKLPINNIHLLSFSNKGLHTARDILQKIQAHRNVVSGPSDLLFSLGAEQHTNRNGERYTILSKVLVTTKNVFKKQFLFAQNISEATTVFEVLERVFDAQNETPAPKSAVQPDPAAVSAAQAPQQAQMPQTPQMPQMPQMPQQQAQIDPFQTPAPKSAVQPDPAAVSAAQAPLDPFALKVPESPKDNSDLKGVVSKDEDLGTMFEAQSVKTKEQIDSLFNL